jgi:hypothetical protein
MPRLCGSSARARNANVVTRVRRPPQQSLDPSPSTETSYYTSGGRLSACARYVWRPRIRPTPTKTDAGSPRKLLR